MRRLVLTAMASALVIALVPASALAHKGRSHHKRHHARTHHTRVRHLRFGDVNSGTGNAGGTTTPTTPPAMPTSIGTVGTFDATTGALTINLTGGQTVS